ncbi:putative metallo-hydrolase YflN [compost metagenome]
MQVEMSYGEDYSYLPMTSFSSGAEYEVLPDVNCLTVQIVNVCMIGLPDSGKWVLVDAGMPHSADMIISTAEKRFGPDCAPQGILLTHGHFDHVGGIIELIEHWGVKVYAHPLEMPYLTGERHYVPPDPSVDGGLIAKMSGLFPNAPIQLGEHIKPLAEDGSIPYLPDWRWIHTPGHTPGHISLFRDKDRTLVAGDAFVTVKQESVYKVLVQEQEISGPPKYFTSDWSAAYRSAEALSKLNPAVAVTGHGQPMRGEVLETGLRELIENFDEIAAPIKH